jgi:DNA-binding transcriptional ArsR family regulator
MESKDVVSMLSALAHEQRLALYRLLVVAGPQGLTPGVMAERQQLPAATLSFHLKEMSHAGLVSAERQGRHLIYRAQFDRMQAVMAYLFENCCGGQPCPAPVSPSACCG